MDIPPLAFLSRLLTTAQLHNPTFPPSARFLGHPELQRTTIEVC